MPEPGPRERGSLVCSRSEPTVLDSERRSTNRGARERHTDCGTPRVHRLTLIALLTACGRIGYEPDASTADAPTDATFETSDARFTTRECCGACACAEPVCQFRCACGACEIQCPYGSTCMASCESGACSLDCTRGSVCALACGPSNLCPGSGPGPGSLRCESGVCSP
jgi:hypothetical protein